MRRILASLLIGLFAILIPVAPADACKWDRDTHNSEREFKSQYEESPGVKSLSPESPSTPSQESVIPLAATGAGAVLLLGAVVLPLRRFRRG